MRHFSPVLREPFRRRPTSPFPSSEHSAAGSLHATAGALDLPLGNR
jgi:hypothetical protein